MSSYSQDPPAYSILERLGLENGRLSSRPESPPPVDTPKLIRDAFRDLPAIAGLRRADEIASAYADIGIAHYEGTMNSLDGMRDRFLAEVETLRAADAKAETQVNALSDMMSRSLGDACVEGQQSQTQIRLGDSLGATRALLADAKERYRELARCEDAERKAMLRIADILEGKARDDRADLLEREGTEALEALEREAHMACEGAGKEIIELGEDFTRRFHEHISAKIMRLQTMARSGGYI